MTMSVIRHNWTIEEVQTLDNQSFVNLLFQAQQIHREHFDPTKIQISTLLSIKTGACPEDCKYCSQSGHYKTAVNKEKLLSTEKVVEQAIQAKENGASRFCMGAAWRSPPTKDFPAVLEMVREVKALGLETCLTAGMLNSDQAAELKSAGLDFYNHNLDTSPEFYSEIVSTHTYQDRLETICHVQDAGIQTCCGGILGMGESQTDRYSFLVQLANLKEHPKSVPINILVPIPGTPLGDHEAIDTISLVRVIALARIMMPKSYIRLSAGRNGMDDAAQALCFLAGANSFFYGEKLLTTPLPDTHEDQLLLKKLGMTAAA